jgi:hypothetical protein
MGPDLRDAIEAMPGLGGVALWVKFLDSDDPELIACTDGVHVEARPGYEKYDGAERRLGYWKKGDHLAEIVRQWSSEALYHLLAKNREQIDLRVLGSEAEFNGKDLAPAMGSSQAAGSCFAEDEIRAWSSRLKAARGSLAGIFNRLVRELPKVKTPWERILRDFLFRHARRKHRPDPSRPSRRWLALESDLRQREGVDLPFERATSAARTGRISLAVDTSGSIDESLLRRFAAEVAAVLEKTEPHLRLIVCDADIHQIHVFWQGRREAAARV